MLELPGSHRVPWEWLKAHACPAIQYRTARDVLSPGQLDPDELRRLYAEARDYKPAVAVLRKQSSQGVWGGNLLGLQALKSERIKDVGTVAQYRRLLEFGWSPEERPLRLAERLFYRLLSRDDDPTLFFEHRAAAGKDPVFGQWAREQAREAAACALAEAGYTEDPRVRGAAHRIATAISHFLRSELADNPIVRVKGRNILHPEAHPPSTLSVSMLAHMANLQRERAGFLERLTTFLAQPPPRRQFAIRAGARLAKPRFVLLGDLLRADSAGNPRDLPLALHWIETLARLGAIESSPLAVRILLRLLRDCDERGVWHPKGLRSLPKGASRLSYHAFPLEAVSRPAEKRQADVTFRLALIARLAGWSLEIR